MFAASERRRELVKARELIVAHSSTLLDLARLERIDADLAQAEGEEELATEHRAAAWAFNEAARASTRLSRKLKERCKELGGC